MRRDKIFFSLLVDKSGKHKRDNRKFTANIAILDNQRIISETTMRKRFFFLNFNQLIANTRGNINRKSNLTKI